MRGTRNIFYYCSYFIWVITDLNCLSDYISSVKIFFRRLFGKYNRIGFVQGSFSIA